MSSATSISANKSAPGFQGSRGSEGSKRSPGPRNPGGPAEPHEPSAPTEPEAPESFRPWHFFLLASLMTATVAVMLARQATPEHLVLISLTIIAAGLAAAGFYRTLAPLAAPDRTMFSEPLTERARAALEREKMLALRSIKELEFDRAMGKLSVSDFEQMSHRLRTRAIALMKQLDEGDSGYRELIERELRARLMKAPGSADRRAAPDLPGTDGAGDANAAAGAAALAPGACKACGTANDEDAKFCKSCGAKL